MPFQPRGRRINVGDELIYSGAASANKYGSVTPGKHYVSVGRRGQNIYIQDDNGNSVTYNWMAFRFADNG